MIENRKVAEETLIDVVNSILPGGENEAIYRKMFESMDDAQFDAYMLGLESGSVNIAIIAPELKGAQLNVKRNLDLAKIWGHEFFERIYIGGENGEPSYLSNVKYLHMLWPLKRQAQFLVKKITIPEDSRTVDNLTGQPTGKSKGSKIAYHELQILAALGLTETSKEFIKYRGGDQVGYNAMVNSLANTGGVSLSALDTLGSRVKVTETLSTFLVSMHLSNTL